MSNQEHTGGLSRRTLIKSSALGSLALAAGGLSLPFSLRRAAAAVQHNTYGVCLQAACGTRQQRLRGAGRRIYANAIYWAGDRYAVRQPDRAVAA